MNRLASVLSTIPEGLRATVTSVGGGGFRFRLTDTRPVAGSAAVTISQVGMPDRVFTATASDDEIADHLAEALSRVAR